MKAAHIFTIIAFVIITSFLATVFVWSTTNYDPLVFKTEPIPIFQKEVTIGQPIVIQFDYCKSVSAQENVERNLVCTDIKYTLPEPEFMKGSTKIGAPKGCGQVDAVLFIPKETNPGQCHVEYEVTYQVNPIRTIVEKFQTTDFKVVLPPGIPVEIIPLIQEEPIEIPLEQQEGK